jgi:hypothetical protein
VATSTTAFFASATRNSKQATDATLCYVWESSPWEASEMDLSPTGKRVATNESMSEPGDRDIDGNPTERVSGKERVKLVVASIIACCAS